MNQLSLQLPPHLIKQLALADELRQAAKWREAAQVYLQLNEAMSGVTVIQHNLALCHFALAEFQAVRQLCETVVSIDSTLWQARILLAKCYRKLNLPLQAEAQFKAALINEPFQGEALLGLADLALNEFGEPLESINWVRPLIEHSEYAFDAELTTLMAQLYDRDVTAEHLNASIIQFSKTAIQIPPHIMPRFVHDSKKANKKLKVGVLSPLLNASPVYFLTMSFFKRLSQQCDLVFFNRGTQKDWATNAFKVIASDWFDVPALSATQLAQLMYEQDLDVLYDLGGWTDPIGLKALSVKPARKQFKWVGGQSVTTGLDCFDGWIGDHWQSPLSSQVFYTEPLINAVDDYAEYTPPEYLPAPAKHKRNVLGIFANPAKVSRAFLQRIASIPGKKCFIHRQFQYERARARVETYLKTNEVEYVCPQSHLEALEAVNQHAIILDTFPYSSGLTAREVLALGSKIQVLEVGSLFCERHTARYQS